MARIAISVDAVLGQFVSLGIMIRAGELSAQEDLASEEMKLDREGMQLCGQSNAAAAVEKMRQALSIRRNLYPASNYPDGYIDLARSLNKMSVALDATGMNDSNFRMTCVYAGFQVQRLTKPVRNHFETPAICGVVSLIYLEGEPKPRRKPAQRNICCNARRLNYGSDGGQPHKAALNRHQRLAWAAIINEEFVET